MSSLVGHARSMVRLVATPQRLLVRTSVWDTRIYTPPITDVSVLRDPSTLSKDHPANIKQAKAAVPPLVVNSFRDDIIDKFISLLTRRGERMVAERVVMETLEYIKRIQYKKATREQDAAERAKIERDPRKILVQALTNCKPLIQLIPVRRGGITYQVPAPIQDKKALFLALRSMVTVCRDTKLRDTRMWQELAQEILLAYANEGKVIKKKEELHRAAEANRAFAHYRFIKRRK